MNCSFNAHVFQAQPPHFWSWADDWSQECPFSILLFLAGPFLCFCMPWLLGVASLCVELFRQSSFTAPSNGTFTPWAACTSISVSLVDSSEPPLSSCWTRQSHWPHVLAYCCRRTEGTCFTTNTVFRTLTYWLNTCYGNWDEYLTGESPTTF